VPTADQSQSATQIANDLLVRIENAQARHDAAAKKLQRVRWRLGASLVLLGPFAIIFAALHSGLKPHEPWGLVLVALETAFLLAALLVPFWPVSNSHTRWISERLKTELFRREYFLFQASLGPYLDQKDLPAKTENRLSAINDAEDPIHLLPMRSAESHQTWRDALEDAAGHRPGVPRLAALVDLYLKRRVEDQKNWFAARKSEHHTRNSAFEGFAKAVLVAAVVASLLHFAFAWRNHAYEAEGWLFVLVFSLPAIGAALIGVQSLLENERLGHSYAYHAQLLDEFAARLRTLRAELDHPDASHDHLQLQFARIVLDVESMFSAELLRWHLVMQPRAPRAEV
jgi:hypothetical protein